MQRWWPTPESNHGHAASRRRDHCDADQGTWERCCPVSSSSAVEVMHNARTMAVDLGGRHSGGDYFTCARRAPHLAPYQRRLQPCLLQYPGFDALMVKAQQVQRPAFVALFSSATRLMALVSTVSCRCWFVVHAITNARRQSVWRDDAGASPYIAPTQTPKTTKPTGSGWAKYLIYMVAKGGIEPPTRGFSIRCSTN